MSAGSGRSSETACALTALLHSWATASTLSWTSFSLFHKPAQQHKHDLERDPPQTQGICFVLRAAAKKATKAAHKKQKYAVDHFKWPQMCTGLAWLFLGDRMHVLMLRDSGCPTPPWLSLQGWGCTAPAPPLRVQRLPQTDRSSSSPA